jgi:5'(3')-deoxyribonucleotidase
MTKPVIAVDLDDVLASSAQGFVDYSNQRWGTHLTIEDYSEHWGEMWGIDHDETVKRAHEIYTAQIVKKFPRFDEAYSVLKKLSKHYALVITASRHRLVEQTTREWLHEHFNGIFKDVHLAGIWDKGMPTEEAINLTKAELCQRLNAKYLIDDHPKHCFAAAQVGIKALLYGSYRWNRDVSLPKGVVRVKDWKSIEAFFETEHGSKL